MISNLTADQWKEYDEIGYVKIGRLEPEQLRKLQYRIDEIMLGKAKLDYDKLMMQLDSTTGAYEDAGAQSMGFKGARLDYRKIQELEHDEVFLEYLLEPVFEKICERIYGPETPVALFRAMFFNKPANRGTFLPWHQDRWTNLDRDPQITVWTAIDPATKENGCIQVIPGSHLHGLINPSHGSGFLNKAQSHYICSPDRVKYLELEPGEVVLMHNHVLHASDVNRSAQSRRAFSVCYMEAATLNNGKAGTFPPVFKKNAQLAEAHA